MRITSCLVSLNVRDNSENVGILKRIIKSASEINRISGCGLMSCCSGHEPRTDCYGHRNEPSVFIRYGTLFE